MNSTLKPVAKPATDTAALQTFANALEVEDILAQASKFANDLIAIAARSQVLQRHILSNKPTSIKLSPADAVRAEFILGQLKQLSETYTERMRMPADHAHRNQPPKYLADATKLTATSPEVALAKVATFMGYRAKFVKDGSKPVDFASFLKGTALILMAAIKDSKTKSHEATKDAIGNQARRRGELDIDAAARVVENEANTSGIIGRSEANNLSTTLANGARVGAVAGVVARIAMHDIADDETIRHCATPFDNLKTMRPGIN